MGLADADIHGDSGLSQSVDSFSGDILGRIDYGDDNTADPCHDDCLRARAGLAVVAAGFERNIQGCARRVDVAGSAIAEGFDLGMWPAVSAMIPSSDDLAVADDHASRRPDWVRRSRDLFGRAGGHCA